MKNVLFIGLSSTLILELHNLNYPILISQIDNFFKKQKIYFIQNHFNY